MANSLFWPWVIYFVALLQLIPISGWKKACGKFLHAIPVWWTAINNFIFNLFARTVWDIQGTEQLNEKDWYLLISNHQSWADILVLGYVLNHKAPTLNFFMKRELLWTLPFAGLAAWLVGCPVLYRHTKEYLAKHPEQKGKDVEITHKACEKFKTMPTTVINFIEGTRFTPEKKQKQDSPYQNLLRPRAGGVAFSLAAMHEYFNKIVNVTIVYSPDKATIWDYFCGRIKKITVRVEVLPITESMIGDYENDREYRIKFQGYLNDLWAKKDKLISDLKQQQ